MKIAILGSTGFVGNVLLARAIDKGYNVRTLVRNPDKLGHNKDKVEFIQGDISQTDKVNECFCGAQAVISTVPPEPNTKEPEKYALIMSDLISTMKKNGINRFIHVGGAAHDGGVNENWTFQRRLLRIFLNVFWKPGLIAKQLEWETLKKSDIEWILVRPPHIVKGKSKGTLFADERNLNGSKIHVEDLVDFMLEQLESDQWLRKAPLVSTP
jgi:putative NADH-flavin reductase